MITSKELNQITRISYLGIAKDIKILLQTSLPLINEFKFEGFIDNSPSQPNYSITVKGIKALEYTVHSASINTIIKENEPVISDRTPIIDSIGLSLLIEDSHSNVLTKIANLLPTAIPLDFFTLSESMGRGHDNIIFNLKGDTLRKLSKTYPHKQMIFRKLLKPRN